MDPTNKLCNPGGDLMTKPKAAPKLGLLEQISYATMGDLWDAIKLSLMMAVFYLVFFGVTAWLDDAMGNPLKGYFDETGISKWNFWPLYFGIMWFALRDQTIPYVTWKDTMVIVVLGYLAVGILSLDKFWQTIFGSLWLSLIMAGWHLVEKGKARWNELHNPQDSLSPFELKFGRLQADPDAE